MTKITYIVGRSIENEYTPTGEADMIYVLMDLLAKYNREKSSGNMPVIKIEEEK